MMSIIMFAIIGTQMNSTLYWVCFALYAGNKIGKIFSNRGWRWR